MSATRRWALFAFEVGLGVIYLAAFTVFATQSRDFLVVRDNERAAAAARATQPSLPAEFEFGEEQPANALLGVDWWQHEDGDEGIWSKARSYMYLPVPPSAADIELTIDGEAFVAPGHDTVDLTLIVDGARAGSWTATYGQAQPPLTVVVPSTATADGLVEIRMDVPAAAVPLHFGDPEEKREVGFLLRSVTLEPR